MYFLRNDYSEGCHPAVLEALSRTNLEQTVGYGQDPYCERAAARIRSRFGAPDAEVEFVSGGTQANLLLISHALRGFQSVLAADSGHIALHEGGSIEATGHKVITEPAVDGKLTPAAIAHAMAENDPEYGTPPGLVYLSDATEIGTIYSRAELEALHESCRANGLYLFLDGARLGAALTAPENDLLPEDLGRLCDAFYVGGTKNGALFGEALVLVHDALKVGFRHAAKQRGAILAKGRLLGLQFDALLEHDLWFDLARRANALAAKLQDGLTAAGVPLLVHSPTNQIFPILPDAEAARLAQEFNFEVWGKPDAAHTTIRLVTSWATQEETVDAFLRAL